jgi:hypothetical protein
MNLFLLGTALIARVVLAGAPTEPGLYWERDGAGVLFVYQEPMEDTTHRLVVDASTGETIQDETKVAAWCKHRRFGESTKASRLSPDKKAKAEVLAPSIESGSWSNGAWSASGGAEWSLVVIRDGKTWPSATCSGGDRIEPFWFPDGTRILWDAYHKGQNMRDTGYHEFIIGPAGLPRIGVVAVKPALRTLAPRVTKALAKAGFMVSRVSTTNTQRAASVVYASEGFEDRAKDVAKAVPGGATVEVLNWPAPFDLIVAVGDSVK